VSFRWTTETSTTSPTSGEEQAFASATRVHFTCQDEATRARICRNAQALVDDLQRDREATTVNAQVARKALRYRRLLSRFSDLNPEDESVDISAFLGIEWHLVDAQTPSDTSEASEASE
jgi:hypothetical protein